MRPKKMYLPVRMVGASFSVLMEKTAPLPLYLREVPGRLSKLLQAPLLKSHSPEFLPKAGSLGQAVRWNVSDLVLGQDV